MVKGQGGLNPGSLNLKAGKNTEHGARCNLPACSAAPQWGTLGQVTRFLGHTLLTYAVEVTKNLIPSPFCCEWQMKRCDYVRVPKMLWVSANNTCDYYLKGALLTAFSMMSAPIRPADVTTSPSLHLYSCTQVWMSISSLSWGYLRTKCRD